MSFAPGFVNFDGAGQGLLFCRVGKLVFERKEHPCWPYLLSTRSLSSSLRPFGPPWLRPSRPSGAQAVWPTQWCVRSMIHHPHDMIIILMHVHIMFFLYEPTCIMQKFFFAFFLLINFLFFCHLIFSFLLSSYLFFCVLIFSSLFQFSFLYMIYTREQLCPQQPSRVGRPTFEIPRC